MHIFTTLKTCFLVALLASACAFSASSFPTTEEDNWSANYSSSFVSLATSASDWSMSAHSSLNVLPTYPDEAVVDAAFAVAFAGFTPLDAQEREAVNEARKAWLENPASKALTQRELNEKLHLQMSTAVQNLEKVFTLMETDDTPSSQTLRTHSENREGEPPLLNNDLNTVTQDLQAMFQEDTRKNTPSSHTPVLTFYSRMPSQPRINLAKCQSTPPKLTAQSQSLDPNTLRQYVRFTAQKSNTIYVFSNTEAEKTEFDALWSQYAPQPRTGFKKFICKAICQPSFIWQSCEDLEQKALLQLQSSGIIIIQKAQNLPESLQKYKTRTLKIRLHTDGMHSTQTYHFIKKKR